MGLGRLRAHGRVVMLLDNHYAPDRRVEYEARLLSERGVDVRVVAWDRRSDTGDTGDTGDASDTGAAGPELVRINVPAPPGDGFHSGRAMLRFAIRVWVRRRELFADADLLVVHDIYLLPLGRLIASARSLPFVYDAHEEYARMEARRYPHWLLRGVTRIESALARSAAFIVVPGETRVHRWSEAGFSHVLVLRNVGWQTSVPVTTQEPEWDVLHAGTLSRERRLDLLFELAGARPDVRIAIAGGGKLAHEVERRSAELPNVSFLGWRTDMSEIILRSRALYYGLDPTHPDAETACPNTLYQALLHRRPLIFFSGGEIAEVARTYSIGVRAQPTATALADAVDEVRRSNGWDFGAAWAAVGGPDAAVRYVDVMLNLVARRGRH